MPMIPAKLPQAVMVQLELTKETATWSVPSLRAALGNIVKVKEASERQCYDGSTTTKTQSKPEQVMPVPTASTLLHNTTRTQCFYCSESHYTDECTKYKDLASRKSDPKLQNRCLVCFRMRHTDHSCVNRRQRFHCR